MELVRGRAGSEQITETGGRRMLGQKIRANISLLHIVHRSELGEVFITLRGSRWVAENLANIDQPLVNLPVSFPTVSKP